MTGTAHASPLDFTGWDDYGMSNVQGTWARFGGLNGGTDPYRIFTRSFFYDDSLSGSGWSTGDTIVAVGGQGLGGFDGLGAAGLKFNMNTPGGAGWSPGDVSTSTNGSSSGRVSPGSFSLQSNNLGTNLTTLSLCDGATYLQSTNDTNPAVFTLQDTLIGDLQIFVNLTTFKAWAEATLGGVLTVPDPLYDTASAFGNMVYTTFYPKDGSLSESLVYFSVVCADDPPLQAPEPGTVTLLGAALLGPGATHRARLRR